MAIFLPPQTAADYANPAPPVQRKRKAQKNPPLSRKTQTNRLLSLPRQLRDRIYEFTVVLTHGVIIIDESRTDVNHFSHGTAVPAEVAKARNDMSSAKANYLALSVVSHQVYTEARQAFFERNVFVTWLPNIAASVAPLPVSQLWAVKHLLLYRSRILSVKEIMRQTTGPRALIIEAKYNGEKWEVDIHTGAPGQIAFYAILGLRGCAHVQAARQQDEQRQSSEKLTTAAKQFQQQLGEKGRLQKQMLFDLTSDISRAEW